MLNEQVLVKGDRIVNKPSWIKGKIIKKLVNVLIWEKQEQKYKKFGNVTQINRKLVNKIRS